MAYIGQDIEGGVLEKQTLAFDSVTTTFELDYYTAENGLIVSINGIIQEPGVAFTVNGKNIVFASAPTYATFVVFIERELTISTMKGLDYIEYQSGTGNGTTTPLTLSNSLTNPEEIMVSLNGITQIPTTDYTVSGTTLTFDEAPTAGTSINVLYLRLETTDGVPANSTITDAKIVSMDASKLTGSLPASLNPDLTPQWQGLNSVGMHWMNLEDKTKINLVQSYYDHFEDDTGWVAYNGPVITSSSASEWSGSTGSFTFSGNNVTATGGNKAIRTAEITGDCNLEFTATTTHETMCFGFYESSEDGTFNSTAGRGGMDSMTNSWLWRDEGTDRVGYGSNLALADIPIADGDTVKLERLSGEFKLHVNGSVVYTWSQQSTNPLRLCFAVDGPSSSAVYTGVTWTTSPAAVNTGSENVGRDTAGEYMSSIYDAYGSSTVLTHTTLANDTITFNNTGVSAWNSHAAGSTSQLDANIFTGGGFTNRFYNTPSSLGSQTWYWASPSTSTTPGASSGFTIDYGTTLRFINFKIHKNCSAAEVMSFRLQYSDDNTSWTNFDLTGSTFSASAELTAQSHPDNVFNASTKDSSGVFTTTTSTSSGTMSGSIWTPATPFSARYVRFDLLTWANRGNNNVGWGQFIPTAQVVSTTANATGTLLSTSTTADATVSETSGVMMYKDAEGTGTLGTDLKVHFSSDDGANWTEASSYDNPISFGGTTKLLTLGKTSLSGGTGTAVKMKAEWANQASPAGTNKTVTAHGNAAASTTQKKIGTHSIAFDGSGDYLQLTNHADWNFGSDNFTIEGWFYMNAVGAHSVLLSNWTSGSPGYSGGFEFYVNSSNKVSFYFDYGANLREITCTTNITTSGWYHAAVVRNGNNFNIYLNGLSEAWHAEALTVDTTTQVLRIGGAPYDSRYLNGYLDEIRISNNARYTADFTPSTTAFTSDANTKLLIHGDDPIADNSAVIGKITQLHGWAVNY